MWNLPCLNYAVMNGFIKLWIVFQSQIEIADEGDSTLQENVSTAIHGGKFERTTGAFI